MFPLSWSDELLMLPVTRRAVRLLAAGAAWTALSAAVCAAAELLLVFLPAVGAFGLLIGLVSSLCSALLMALMALLWPWCQVVLLAERGIKMLRPVALFVLFFALLYPLCVFYSLFTGEALLAQQGLLTLAVPLLLLFLAGLHWGYTAAAPMLLRIRLTLSPLLLLLVLITDVPEILPLCLLFKGLLAWALFRPLRQLAALVPHLAELPPLPPAAEDAPGDGV